MARTRALAVEAPPPVDEYPFSDGKIMAETPRHVDAILYALATLRVWFAGYSRVQVGANMFVYYQEDDKTKHLTPDLFVVRGLEALPERSYKIWEAGRPPTFVLEVASPSTEERDRGEKQALYASMGVAEYWRFDPIGFLKDAGGERVRLTGGALQGLGYEPLETEPDGSIRSKVLELDVRVDERPGKGHLLRFRNPKAGKDLLTFQESEDGRRAAEDRQRAAEVRLRRETAARQRAERAKHEAIAARRAAEAEIARLKAHVDNFKDAQGGSPNSES